MSHKPATVSIDEIFDRLPPKTRTVLCRIARRIVNGFDGEVQLLVLKGGGVRHLRWTQTESGDSISEEL